MQRKRLDTVYLPVLWDGQTLHPSKQFPALPLTRGEDVLKEVLDGAKARGIRVVGVLHTMAWRFPLTDNTHRLRKYPQIMDVDALGRTRGEWAKAHPLSDAAAWPDEFTRAMAAANPLRLSDFIRPGAPDVRTRLLGILAELARYPLDGVALDLWTRHDPKGVGAPPLGYALPQRAAFLAKHGVDPLDVMDDPTVPYPGPFAPVDPMVQQAWAATALTADITLAKDLLAEAGKTWPGQVRLFSDLHTTMANGEKAWVEGRQVDLPVTDALILSGISHTPGQPNRPARPLYRRISIPAPQADDADGKAGRITAFAREVARFARGRATLPWTIPGVLLDFRTAPDLLWDALRLLSPTPPATP